MKINTVLFCGILLLSNNLFSQDLSKDYSKKYDFYKPDKNLNDQEFILSIFKDFWTLSDSIENELIKKHKAEKRIKYKDEPDEVSRYYLDTIQKTIRNEFHSAGDYVSELRILFFQDNVKVLKSNFSGTVAFTRQNSIKLFEFDKVENKFRLDSLGTKLFNVELKDFLKDDTPDSIINELSTHTSYFFQITYNEYGIAESTIFEENWDKNITDNKWLKGNKIIYYLKNGSTIETEIILDK